jgi:quercetin dioxygenase-like cupin family protein
MCYACFVAEIDGRRLGRALPGSFRSIISLTGALTVKQEDGSNTKFKSGESFFQPRMERHRCVKEGKRPMLCLFVLPRAKVAALPQRVN